jgi:hypothetical protein
MTFTPLLAHGALGPWDELIFLSVFVIFIIIMGVSWVRSRALGDDDLEDGETAAPETQDAGDGDDRFALK